MCLGRKSFFRALTWEGLSADIEIAVTSPEHEENIPPLPNIMMPPKSATPKGLMGIIINVPVDDSVTEDVEDLRCGNPPMERIWDSALLIFAMGIIINIPIDDSVTEDVEDFMVWKSTDGEGLGLSFADFCKLKHMALESGELGPENFYEAV
jgi:hypothetical protein